jgi:hypothetical protein
LGQSGSDPEVSPHVFKLEQLVKIK